MKSMKRPWRVMKIAYKGEGRGKLALRIGSTVLTIIAVAGLILLAIGVREIDGSGG
jgi:hypothetical protein